MDVMNLTDEECRLMWTDSKYLSEEDQRKAEATWAEFKRLNPKKATPTEKVPNAFSLVAYLEGLK